jgi:uncharacterized protein YybS (DUF2232 family)
MIDMSLPPQAGVETAPAAPFWRSTVAYALLTSSLILFQVTVFVPAALLDCGLRNGRRAAWIAFAIALSVVAVSAPVMLRFGDVKLTTSYVAAVMLSHALPALAVLPLVQRRVTFGRVVAVMVLVGAAGLAVGELGVRTIAGFSPYTLEVAEAKKATGAVIEAYKAGGIPADGIELARRVFGYLSTTLMPSGLLLSATTAFLLSMLMVGRLSAWRGRHDPVEDETYRFRHFALPEWMLFVFVIGGLLPLTHGVLQAVLANVLTVAVFLFLMQGFALFRFMLAAMGVGFLGAVVASMFVSFSVIGLFLLAIAGLFDPFFDFRHFKKRKDDSHESHSD